MRNQEQFNYSSCLFEARLQKLSILRRREQFYLYFSPDKVIINKQPYSKKPDIILELMPTTHVKWLWQSKRDKKDSLKGFIIETEGHLNQFIAEKVVLDMLKMRFKEITLQSDFYDEYSLGKYIDKGNYAQVYQCKKKQNDQRYAVKILEKERLKTIKNGKESVFNELKILRHLHHKNLMQLFEVFEDRNKYYFVLQLLQGTTLYKQIQNRKKKKGFKPSQIRGIIRQLIQGVKYMTDHNIMHRDIKPENILYDAKQALDTGDGSQGLKIVDYGLATFQHESHIIFTKCGTPGFVAPQIITYDQKQSIYQVNVDIFSVGVILHILLVGEQAFPGRSRNTILNKNKECKVDFKNKKYESIASDGIDLLSKLLQKNPQKRIRPSQALTHPFLIKDRPIFKFKKNLSDIKQNLSENLQMKMYKNLQEIALQDDKFKRSTTFDRNFHGSDSNAEPLIARNKVASQYLDELIYYNPFSYEQQLEISQKEFNTRWRRQEGGKYKSSNVMINDKNNISNKRNILQRSVKQVILLGKRNATSTTSTLTADNQTTDGKKNTPTLTPNANLSTIPNAINQLKSLSKQTDLDKYEDIESFFNYQKSRPT